MNCMKCGREIEADQVFCTYCLIEMENHPVKPGTVILLPDQKASTPKKTVKKKKLPPTPEEIIVIMKRKLIFYRIISLLLSVAVCGLLYLSGRVLIELDIQRLLGQNYSTVTEPSETEAPELTEST